MMFLKLSIREILNSKKFALFFTFNLALGLSAFLVIDTLKSSISRELSNGSRNLLGADFSIQCRNRHCNSSEIQALHKLSESGTELSRGISFISMLASTKRSRLASVNAIEKNFPFFGEILLEDGTTFPSSIRFDKNGIWLYPELALLLKVKIGDELKLGSSILQVRGIVKADSTSAPSAFDFVPRAYISLSALEKTELIREGSRFNELWYLKVNSATQEEVIEQNLRSVLKEPDIKIVSHIKASENLARALTYLNDYLGLIALVALFLSAIGCGFLFQSHLYSRRKDIAILKTLGASPNSALLLYIIELCILGLSAAIVAIFLASLISPVFPSFFSDLLPIAVKPRVHWITGALAIAVGSFASILACLPLALKVRSLPPKLLFQDIEQSQSAFLDILRTLLYYVPALVFYWLLALLESRSFKIASLFMITLVGASLIFLVASTLVRGLFNRVSSHATLTLKLALRALARQRAATTACFLAIATGSMLLALVPQIYDFVNEEVSRPKGLVLPSLFLVDIQEDQVDALEANLRQRKLQLEHLSPLIRARLTAINGVALRESRDAEGDENNNSSREVEASRWARTRGQNLSYRLEPFDSEKIVKGKPFPGAFDPEQQNIPLISLEMRYADRLGVKVGDTLEFDIQGVPITGSIANIRRVRWTSFQPNFFISFQPGVFEDAPKTYLASIPPLKEQEKFALQDDLVDAFPNISFIDVKGTVDRILKIVNLMSVVIQAMAFFTLFAGAVVLYSIANHQANLRQWDINLYKVLGAGFGRINGSIFLEFFILVFTAAMFGTIGSCFLSFFIVQEIFASPWTFSYEKLVWIPFAIALLASLIALLATRKVLNEKPLGLLNDA